MKSCPTCNKTFTDPNLSFCIEDGTPLVSIAEPADETGAPSSSEDASVPSPYKPRDWQAPDYQPPGFQTSTPSPPRKKTWPWVVGVLAVLAIGVIGIGIALAILIPNMVRKASNQNNSNLRVERSDDPAPNLNSNAPNSNSNNQNDVTSGDEDDATPPPTDKGVVLGALRALEEEWTVANINADKQKLNRILADDYVTMFPDGNVQGKAEYLRTIKRDTTSIQSWNFEDLNVTLMGDRATLDGVLRYQLPDRETSFRFTDKFVWRDGRWQAVGSEVSRIK